MNLSSASFYDNVDTPEAFSKSTVYQTINDLLSINGNVQVKIFCPLCGNNFNYKFSLFEHLRTVHSNYLLQAGNQTLKFNECPFCCAKFCGDHLTAKHTLLHHLKVVTKLFFNNKSARCSFCSMKLDRDDFSIVGKHIEELHFLEYEEEFKKIFGCDENLEGTLPELINSSITEVSPLPIVCMAEEVKETLINTNVKDFPKASTINCYDFSDLKEQLENIKKTSSVKKPILKDVKNSVSRVKSVRRVLRFDIPDSNDKENSVLKQNLQTFKEINIDEHSLLCHDNKSEIDQLFKKAYGSNENFYGEPQHSSTPNLESQKNFKTKSNFKSYLCSKQFNNFEFQCGKCKKLFRENLDLVFHVKNSHRKFSLNALQPCYRCAICNARFYKNFYLKKHHILHKPY